mmetsp:Transcript_34228/g.72911  ORF Transcript_34228/g.72911 Transcript_34228/m.72911 type:complete len:108 (+) Transcript_34228:298-621(+)
MPGTTAAAAPAKRGTAKRRAIEAMTRPPTRFIRAMEDLKALHSLMLSFLEWRGDQQIQKQIQKALHSSAAFFPAPEALRVALILHSRPAQINAAVVIMPPTKSQPGV